jgi:hypothetical protein
MRLRISTAAMALLMLISSTALAASQTSTIRRVYVSNAALSITIANHPSGCPWGIVASDQDPAYDRWISLAMLAFQNQTTTVVEYDAASCKLQSLALTAP